MTLPDLIRVSYLLTARNRLFVSWEVRLNFLKGVKKFNALYGNIRFITAFKFTAAIPYPEPTQSSTCPLSTSWTSIFILFSHKILDTPNGLFPLKFPTKSLYRSLLFPVVYMALPIFLLGLITRKIFGDIYRSQSSSLCSFLRCSVNRDPLRTKYSP